MPTTPRILLPLRTVLSHRYSLAAVSLLLLSSGAVSTYAYLAYQDAARFRDQLITRKYEGTLTEDLGFLTALTAHTSLASDPLEKQRTERLHTHLLAVRNELQRLKVRSGLSLDQDILLEDVSEPEILLALLGDRERVRSLSLREIGLTECREAQPRDRPCLQTSDRDPPSFVFIPAPLVEMYDGEADLPYNVKRDLVLSKLIEPYLFELDEGIMGAKIKQAYFIPLSGFIRIHALSTESQKEEDTGAEVKKKDRFPAVRSFSDRTYYHETKSEYQASNGEGGFRRSEPYLDVAGGGLVSTYSIYLENGSLGLAGMIGVDCEIESLGNFWEQVTLGLRPFRDFIYGSYTIGDTDTSPPDIIKENCGNQDHHCTDSVRRFVDGKATIFTAPKGSNEIAYFIFEPQRIKEKYVLLGFAYLGSLAALALIAFLIFYFQRATVSSERRQAEIVANLNGGFLVVDDHEVILTANEKFCSLVEDDRPRMKPVARYLTEESLNEYLQLKPRGGFEFSGRVRTPDGTVAPVIISSAPLRFEGSLASRMLILIPSAELELTIAKKFLHIFSHALKTPVHNILMIADHFRRKKSFRKFDHYFSMMQNKIKEFTVLVDDVLRFSELDIKQIKLDRQPINVAKALRKSLASVRERAEIKGLSLIGNISESLRANADAEMLGVVFNNLIDNALKYSDEGEVEVDAVDRATDIVITFSDTGIGVPEEEKEDIFKMFFQGRYLKGGKRGLGLGLYVSKKYVELHGGTLTYEPRGDSTGFDSSSAAGVGSKFVVNLPKAFD